MNHIIDLLKGINLSDAEAEIYLYLMKHPGQTPFQIAQHIHLSKKVTYETIDSMYEKGLLLLEHGQKDLYFVESIDAVIDTLQKKQAENIKHLKKSLDEIELPVERTPYLNLVGYFNILGKIRTLLYGAEKEVYMNTDLDIHQFDDAFSHLERKGVDVYIFSFVDHNYKRTNVHLFTHGMKPTLQTRMMLVVDDEQVLVANYMKQRDEWSATLTKNQLMTNIITEHIHHDIYLLKLNQKEGKPLFNSHPDLYIDTKFERNHRIKMHKKTD